MMKKRIVYTRPDGGVSVVVPAPGGRKENESEEKFLERLKATVVPKGATNVCICDQSKLPARDAYRNALRQTRAGAPKVDMAEARAIHMDHIRAVRNRELERLDKEWYGANDADDTVQTQRIAKERGRLRDIPQTFDLTAAITPENLKTLWPKKLPRS